MMSQWSSKAEQDRKCLEVPDLETGEQLVNFHNAWHWKGLPFLHSNMLSIFLQKRCKMLLPAHCSHDCKIRRIEKNVCMDKQLPSNQTGDTQCSTQRNSCGRAVVTMGLICIAETVFSSEILRHRHLIQMPGLH